jgi:hypothetical protein
MATTRDTLKDDLFAVMQPYIERLRDPEVISATDAAKAAGVIKALYEKCVEERSPAPELPSLTRAEIVEIVRGALAAAPEGKETE